MTVTAGAQGNLYQLVSKNSVVAGPALTHEHACWKVIESHRGYSCPSFLYLMDLGSQGLFDFLPSSFWQLQGHGMSSCLAS